MPSPKSQNPLALLGSLPLWVLPAAIVLFLCFDAVIFLAMLLFR